MENQFVKTLVVDDLKIWRDFVSATVQIKPELRVIGEASNGLEAVRKAEELQPDLVLLDIGLPGLNGIEAGKQIRKCSPKSKIVFVSEMRSADIARAALLSCGNAYVVKSCAGRELLTAVASVLQGKPFVGTGFDGEITVLASEPTADHYPTSTLGGTTNSGTSG